MKHLRYPSTYVCIYFYEVSEANVNDILQWTRKYARVDVLGNYLFFEAHSYLPILGPKLRLIKKPLNVTYRLVRGMFTSQYFLVGL